MSFFISNVRCGCNLKLIMIIYYFSFSSVLNLLELTYNYVERVLNVLTRWLWKCYCMKKTWNLHDACNIDWGSKLEICTTLLKLEICTTLIKLEIRTIVVKLEFAWWLWMKNPILGKYKIDGFFNSYLYCLCTITYDTFLMGTRFYIVVFSS